jgi:hypothetical protein
MSIELKYNFIFFKGIMVLNEINIFKKSLISPSYCKTLVQDLEKENTKIPGGKQALRLFYKVWSGFTKYIRAQ